MINKNDIKFFKRYGFIFKRNLIPASEIEQCLMSANKIKNKKILTQRFLSTSKKVY